jgi:hypothetical protein
MFCHKCGTKSLEDAAFCLKCGEKLIFEETHPQQQTITSGYTQPVVTVPPKKPKPVLLIGFAAVIVAAIIGFIIYISMGSGVDYIATVKNHRPFAHSIRSIPGVPLISPTNDQVFNEYLDFIEWRVTNRRQGHVEVSGRVRGLGEMMTVKFSVVERTTGNVSYQFIPVDIYVNEIILGGQSTMNSNEIDRILYEMFDAYARGEIAVYFSIQSNHIDNKVDVIGTAYNAIYIERNSNVSGHLWPRLNLSSDGNFTFNANLFTGMGVVSGSYTILNDIYTFNVTSRNFTGFVGDDVEIFTMRRTENELMYTSNDAIGLTSSGAIFTRN